MKNFFISIGILLFMVKGKYGFDVEKKNNVQQKFYQLAMLEIPMTSLIGFTKNASLQLGNSTMTDHVSGAGEVGANSQE